MSDDTVCPMCHVKGGHGMVPRPDDPQARVACPNGPALVTHFDIHRDGTITQNLRLDRGRHQRHREAPDE